MKFLSSLILIACIIPSIVFSMGGHQSPLYCKLGSQLSAQSAKKLGKKHAMNVCGMTDGMMNNINLLGFSFEIFKPLSKNEARTLAVSCVQEFLDDINKSEKIRSYLVVYPFDAKKIEISIYVQQTGSRAYHPNLSVVSAFNGKIAYSTDDLTDPYQFKVREIETFEDAVKILKGEIPAPESEIK